ncbi:MULTISPECIES: amidase family protein [Bradyrhizobium]|uniref:amidase family protein n=1 Tax=Bradyrhizobium TaxID=374 RepID=UPI00155E5374|nr:MULTISPECIES: amidase family protein [Bradyrhizobium]MDD1519060.1 amidase [Bradyrhizobium sp. WBAH30]MDD1540942.1 amidase [Bradyrhizobium sp. WBAH41]MDD1557434.1 amidase [Bradyrhizobium sp. WBAH23]MDD1563577.1 amidase [Bradyrhizobium sp. WBAH33]MDD1590254.1 amidase [Bradyrhizobium sp. WBAH42]
MKKPSRRDAGIAAAAVRAEAPISPKLDHARLDHASMSDIAHALANGHVTATALLKAYLARIQAYDRDGPRLNAVRTLNPDALAIAARLDGVKSPKRPLAGIPILVKDNIATGDKQPTTAGSLALEGAHARDDATLVKLLREAGAVIVGKANLTEFSNMIAVDMPAGYSSLGGQVKNPYAPALADDHGIPVVSSGGSSAGSAVAVAAGLCAASIGTETSGSLLFPASQNGLVTVKPTVGLISRAGIVPIAHSQDTAGPMTRTVRDAALLLNVLAAKDPLDPATQKQRRPDDFTDGLAADAMKGARIGVPSDPADPLNDCFYGKLPSKAAKLMAETIQVLEDLGAVIVRASMPTLGWIGGPGTTMAVLNRNPLSAHKGTIARPPIVFLYEMKHGLNLYLNEWATNTDIKTIADIVAFNEANADRALRFGQDHFLAAEMTRGDLSEREYKSARAMDLLSAKTRGMDAYMSRHELDAVLFPGAYGAAIAAKAGYPSVMVPGGFVSGTDDGKDTPDYPFGVTFAGRAWSEHKLLRLAYAFEQASAKRKPPPGLPAL